MQQEEIDVAKRHRSFDELMEERDRQRAARSRTQKAGDWLASGLYRLWDYHLHPRAIWAKIHRFGQRRVRGFDDSDLWSLDYTVLQFMIPRLRRFQATVHGYPAELLGDLEEHEKLSEGERRKRGDQALEEWRKTIGKMIRAMELWLEHDGIFLKPREEELKEGPWVQRKYEEAPELEAEFQEGWELFHKFFFALWN
jgi:hypothetical protein